ncbi:MAG: ABC transporter ATP-binding protein [Bacteroidetes bacterium]|nr:ABC transporter ATP-binding protein [Bacteroidota bacterium]
MRALLGEEKRRFSLTLVLAAVAAVLEGIGIGLLLPFLENLLNPNSSPLATGWSWFDRVVLAVDQEALGRLYRVSAVILCSIWLRVLVAYAGSVIGTTMVEAILDRLRRRLVDQVQSVAVSFFSTARTGDILNTITSEINRLKSLFEISRMFIVTGLMIVTYLVIIVVLSWQLALLTLAFCGLLFGVLSGLLRKLKRSGRVIAQNRANVSMMTNEIIGGIRTINEFGTQAYEGRRFGAVSEEARVQNVAAYVRSAIAGPLSQGIAATTLIVMVIVAVQLLIWPGYMSTAALFAFLVVLLRLLPLVQSVNTSRAVWFVYRGALDRVTDLLRRDDKPYLVDGNRPFSGIANSIRLDGVSFGYEPKQVVIDAVTLEIPRGKITAVVGASGAGKSTLVDLIARFYDPDQGIVSFDGVDCRELRIADMRRAISVVNQHTFLFNDSVRNNIAYGLEGVSEASIREAAEEANAMEFIRELTDEFDTMLGERGARLSGGQRQRIAIARALLRNPDILILDEATSALDSVSEHLVQESLERLMEGRTVIVIAHRLSTVESADQIIVLENGRVQEVGTYKELIEKKGQLWEYHALQYQLV